jgi:prepilin-type N-terminal cleavage/methylation domain-containing protein
MTTRVSTTRPAFSMIEMVLVVIIIGVIAAIAAPRFAEAGSGRRLSSASKIIERDISSIQLRAKATGKIHTLVFYPASDMYIALEGTDIRKDAIVFMRELDEAPLSLDLARTDIGDNQDIVISAFGGFDKAFTVTVADDGIEREVSFTANGFTRPAITETDTDLEVDVKVLEVEIKLDSGFGLSLSS